MQPVRARLWLAHLARVEAACAAEMDEAERLHNLADEALEQAFAGMNADERNALWRSEMDAFSG